MSELTIEMMEADMQFNEISQPCLYSKQLDDYIWQQREKWTLYGFAAGGLASSIFWLIVLGW